MKRCICAPRPLLLGRDCKHRAADDKGLVLHSSPRFPWQNSQPPARSSCERVLASTRLENDATLSGVPRAAAAAAPARRSVACVPLSEFPLSAYGVRGGWGAQLAARVPPSARVARASRALPPASLFQRCRLPPAASASARTSDATRTHTRTPSPPPHAAAPATRRAAASSGGAQQPHAAQGDLGAKAHPAAVRPPLPAPPAAPRRTATPPRPATCAGEAPKAVAARRSRQ